MTLSELLALDPAALWAGLTVEQQASIIVPLITSVLAEVVQDDDGTDASEADRGVAAGICQDSHQAIYDALDRAFPEILGSDPTALHGFDVSMLDEAGKIRVKGVRKMRVVRQTRRYSETVKIGGRAVEIAGFKRISAPGEPEVWQAWTQAQVDAERIRRWPDQAYGPHQPGPAPSFRSVVQPASITHQEHQHAA